MTVRFTYKAGGKGKGIIVFLVFFFISGGHAKAQTHQVSLSLEPTHLNTDYTQWFNAAGVKMGYGYRFKDGSFVLAELGFTSMFGRDTSGGGLLGAALDRKSLKYRIFRANSFFKLAQVKKSSFYANVALALRHANEIFHDFGAATLTEESTSEILVTTVYDVRWDVGTSFGLSYQYKLSSSIEVNLFSEADIYGEQTSSVTSGLRLLFNL